VGDKWGAEEADRFAIEVRPRALADALAPYGLTEADVTDIVVTHLHFDHNGGLTEWEEGPGGRTRLRFPQARHWVHEQHWRHATAPTERDRASFLDRDLEALGRAGVLRFVTGDDPPAAFKGVGWCVSHGHTPYQLLPLFEGEGGGLLFVGDLIPTMAHLPVPWIMAYDVAPLVTLEEKKGVYRRCREEGLSLAFPHDPEAGGVSVGWVQDKPIVARVLDL